MPAKTKFELKAGPATREAFGKALVELGRTTRMWSFCDADLSKSTYTADFGKEFPDRFFECGIAEANMVAIGAGLPHGRENSFRFQFLGVRASIKASSSLRVTAAFPNTSISKSSARTAASPSAKTDPRR